MKDKLYKTNRKIGFYRARKAVLSIFFLAVAGATLVLPYRFVNQTINELQAKTPNDEPPTGLETSEFLELDLG